MNGNRHFLLGGRLLPAAVLAVGIMPALAGCGTMPTAAEDPFGVPRILSLDSLGADSNTKSEAFKRKVEEDPFPTAPKSCRQ